MPSCGGVVELKRKREEFKPQEIPECITVSEFFVRGKKIRTYTRFEMDMEQTRDFISDLFWESLDDSEEEEDGSLLPLVKIKKEEPSSGLSRPGGAHDPSEYPDASDFLKCLEQEGCDPEDVDVRRVACELAGEAEWIGRYGQENFWDELRQKYEEMKIKYLQDD